MERNMSGRDNGGEGLARNESVSGRQGGAGGTGTGGGGGNVLINGRTAVHAGSGGNWSGVRRRIRQRLLGVSACLFLAALAGAPAWGQEAPAQKRYELAKYIPTGIHVDKFPIDKENLELCKAYEANLNAFPEVKAPFVCARPIYPGFKDFSKPKWKELDPVEHIDLLVKTARARHERFNRLNPFDEAAIRKSILKGIQIGYVRLKLAELDVVPARDSAIRGPDGVPEKVLRVEWGDPHCDPGDDRWRRHPPNREYYIASDDLTKVRVFEAVISRDVFLYKGKVYFDSFHKVFGIDPDRPEYAEPRRFHPGLERERYEIYVGKPLGNGIVRVCRYRYVEPE